MTCTTPLLPKVPCDMPPPFWQIAAETCLTPSCLRVLFGMLYAPFARGCSVTCFTPLLTKAPCDMHPPFAKYAL